MENTLSHDASTYVLHIERQDNMKIYVAGE